MKIFLVRHGESEGNLGGTLQGCRLDTPLTRARPPPGRGPRRPPRRGRVRRRRREPDGPRPGDGRDLRRAARPRREARPRARRVRLGRLDGPAARRRDGPERRRAAGEVALGRRRRRPAPGRDARSSAGARAARVLARLKAARPAAPLVVAHGRFNRILMATLLGRDLARMDEVRQRNGSISIFEWDGAERRRRSSSTTSPTSAGTSRRRRGRSTGRGPERAPIEGRRRRRRGEARGEPPDPFTPRGAG